ncbi:MAG: Zn-ribbon domain-containing OB-fold protein [Deltaproteobacteria bacterium]|nr:Zn-ribbon domain-containing OB-fold protein [Deltaproteobacteria bacterium]MBI2534705.1 Zn-ribbon domain-containing OB-fold protein [Deltaproteobacteria bacterium]
MSKTQDERGRAARRGQPFLDEPEAKPFWASLREHRLTAQRCSSCKKIFNFPPQARCPHCLASDYEWAILSGKGKVYSCVTYHRPWHPAYQDKIPYNVSLIDLDEGGRIVSNVVDCPPDEVRIAMAVEVVYEDLPEYTLPKFRPVKSA